MRDGFGKLDGYGRGTPKEGFGAGIFREEHEVSSCACSEEDWGMTPYREEDWGII